MVFFFSSRRRHTRWPRDWSSDVCSSDLFTEFAEHGLGHLTRVFGTQPVEPETGRTALHRMQQWLVDNTRLGIPAIAHEECLTGLADRKSTRLNSSHVAISYAVFCLKKKKLVTDPW